MEVLSRKTDSLSPVFLVSLYVFEVPKGVF